MSSARDDVDIVEDQLGLIKAEVDRDPLLSQSETLSMDSKIVVESSNDELFHNKSMSLFTEDVDDAASSRTYRCIRYARRDGNCFYRCAAFRLFELMLSTTSLRSTTMHHVQESTKRMVAQFGEYSEDFAEVVKDLIKDITSSKISSVEQLYERSVSEDAAYVIVFLRYAISMYIRDNADDFLPFVMGTDYENVEAYCAAEVEPVDRDCDHVQLVAFAKLFEVNLIVEVMDRSAGTRTNALEFTGGDSAVIYLLYRPGHYDLLYK